MRWQALRQRARELFKEGLAPGPAAAAVFVGIFIANVPIYGFQLLAAAGIAVLFRLNKPLTLAATFINNPLVQPVLVVAAVETGNLVLSGKWYRPGFEDLTLAGLKAQFAAWLVGGVLVGAILGGAGAIITFLFLRLRAPAREDIRFVNRLFKACDPFDRRFVYWKIRLDRIFDLLAREDPGSGTVVDLGCGYGIALAFAAFRDRSRRLVGFDLDRRRIAAARRALHDLNVELEVADIRSVVLPQAGLIMILDVLQYLDANEQSALLLRCVSALAPGGVLIFRAHDRARGLQSKITMAFDRLIFRVGGVERQPLMLHAREYRGMLEQAGLQMEVRPLPNRLPLAHHVFLVRRPR